MTARPRDVGGQQLAVAATRLSSEQQRIIFKVRHQLSEREKWASAKKLVMVDSHPRAHDRDDQPGGADLAPDASGDRPGAAPRGTRRKAGNAARKNAQGLTRQAADPPGGADPRGWGFQLRLILRTNLRG